MIKFYILASLPALWFLYRWIIVKKNRTVYDRETINKQLNMSLLFIFAVVAFALWVSVKQNNYFYMLPTLLSVPALRLLLDQKRRNFKEYPDYDTDEQYDFIATSVIEGYYLGDVQVGDRFLKALLESQEHDNDENIQKIELKKFKVVFIDDRIHPMRYNIVAEVR